ncbi:unnamed protein product [Ectocarpus sp. CCAP 1310/34]|nr:unnamed protein product [Ectocarpus sp. CCAP 1310/34]
MEMSGQNLFDALDTALVPKAAKAALLGLLLQLISPDVELTGLMSRIMWRFTKAHQASTRKALSLGYLLGPERLKEDFLGQVTKLLRALLLVCRPSARLFVNATQAGSMCLQPEQVIVFQD